MNTIARTLFALAFAPLLAQAHDHMPAGATAPTPGATLQYAPTAEDFTTNSGCGLGHERWHDQ